MANIINLATETKQDEIIANVVNVKETVNAVNTNVNNVNTNVNANKSTLATVNANLGTPTSGASNATNANAHAKLNALLSNTAKITNIADDAFGANMFNSVLSHSKLVQISSEASGSIITSLTGKMLLKNVTISLYGNPYYSTVNIDGRIYKPTDNGSLLTFKFSELYINSFLRVNPTKNYEFSGIGLVYEDMYLFP